MALERRAVERYENFYGRFRVQMYAAIAHQNRFCVKRLKIKQTAKNEANFLMYSTHIFDFRLGRPLVTVRKQVSRLSWSKS